MRVMQVVHKPQRRGAEVFASELSAQLRGRGCDVRSVYLYPHAGPAALPLEPTDVALGGREDHPWEHVFGVHPGLLKRLLAEISEFQPDVVQVNGARTVKYGAMARLLARGAWPLVYRNIGDPREWVRGWRQRVFYRTVVMPAIDGVVGVSDATLKNLRAFYPLRIPMVRIPRAVDVTSFAATASREQVRATVQVPVTAPVLLFVGSIAQEKRPDRLLRVLAKVLQRVPGARLWVVGDGPLRREFEAQATADALAEAVTMFGVQDRVADFMAAADVLLLTSDTEGTPGVVLEAGCVGLPAVATRVGGVEDCVIDRQTGLLAAPADEEGLAAAVLALLDDAQLRSRMGQAARRHITDAFDLGVVASQYVRLYEDVLAGRSRAPHRYAAAAP